MANKHTFSTSLFIKKGQNYKNGEARIFIRITVNGERKEISTGTSIMPEHWDSNKTRVKNGVTDFSAINQNLESLRYKIQQCRRDLIEEDIPVTAQNILDRYNGTDKENKYTLEIFDEHNCKCEELSGIDFAHATIQKYKSCRKIVASFIRKKYKKQDLPIIAIDHKFIIDLEHYFKTVKGCSHNTTVKYIQNFRKIVLIGINNGWLKKDPYANIRFRKEKTYPVFLDQAELDRIRNKKLTVDRMSRVRDIFVFCCYTGLAYSDVKELSQGDISIDANGKKWIRKLRKKTGVISPIPLLSIPEKLIEKYKHNTQCISSNKLLPVLSNQKMNAYLKELGDLCGIQKEITTHTARHTFATTVTLSNDIPIEVVSQMLGHTNLQMTKHYARVIDPKIASEMEKIERKLMPKTSSLSELINSIHPN